MSPVTFCRTVSAALAGVLAVAPMTVEAATAAPKTAVRGCVDRLAQPAARIVAAYPPDAQHVGATAYVTARLHASGRLDRVDLYRSSADPALDGEALAAVADARFRPALKNCVAYSSNPVVPVLFVGGAGRLKPDNAKCAEGVPMLRVLARPAAPGSPQRGHDRGLVVLAVTVEANNTVSDVELMSSSGSERLDREAKRIARASVYTAGRDEDCNPQQNALTLELAFR